MVLVEVWTDATWWFECEGCSTRTGHRDLAQVAYEGHDDCYTSRPWLIKRIRTDPAMYSDLYSYMASRIYSHGLICTEVWASSMPSRHLGTIRLTD